MSHSLLDLLEHLDYHKIYSHQNLLILDVLNFIIIIIQILLIIIFYFSILISTYLF